MNPRSYHYSKGFSLVEILVSVAVFSVVVIAGTAAILAVIDANQKSQSLNSVMTNLNVALESMAREIRVGKNYACVTGHGIESDCTMISFTPDIGVGPIYYEFVSTGIQKRVGSDTATPLRMTATEVNLTDVHFKIRKSTDGTFQDKVFLTISGYAQAKIQTKTNFYIQTLMSKRDIIPAS